MINDKKTEVIVKDVVSVTMIVHQKNKYTTFMDENMKTVAKVKYTVFAIIRRYFDDGTIEDVPGLTELECTEDDWNVYQDGKEYVGQKVERV